MAGAAEAWVGAMTLGEIGRRSQHSGTLLLSSCPELRPPVMGISPQLSECVCKEGSRHRQHTARLPEAWVGAKKLDAELQ